MPTDRRSAGLLTLVGAVALGVGCWLPYQSVAGTDYEVFQHSGGGFSGQLYFAVEPAVVMVVAAVLGLVLLRTGLAAAWPAVLIAVGSQTVLLWVGYLGSLLAADSGPDSPHMKAGGWVGILGSVLIIAGGAVGLRASAAAGGSGTPAGWYADPTGAAALRYWSGSFWTEHTADRPAAG